MIKEKILLDFDDVFIIAEALETLLSKCEYINEHKDIFSNELLFIYDESKINEIREIKKRLYFKTPE